ncbi:MAG: protein translocase subunit SecD [Candidatus Hydrogenedens sp.]|jgi:SecD/SecF fusion protein|nr:protein translocase subunit SecD [Candidatus Hydrogenedens sp.]
MSKSIYRSLLIGASLVLAFIYVYPTIGWMLLSEESRTERLEKWQKEDDELARRQTNYFESLWMGARRWVECDRDKVINLGLDLQGGIHMVIGFDINNLSEEMLDEYRNERRYSDENIEKEVQQIVLQQITRRINDFEAKEPVIQTLGTNQIQVQLPGEKDVQRAKNLITKTAQMNFHIVAGPDESRPVFEKIRDTFPNEFIPFVKTSSMRPDVLTVTVENYDRVRRVLARAEEAGIIPEDKTIAFSQQPKPYDRDQEYQLYVFDKKPIASGEGLTSAAAIQDQSNMPYWQILFSFGASAAANFADATGANIGKPMAIVLDGVVVSAPTIRDRIAGGRGQISGNFEAPEAVDLAIALNSGSMVVPVREEFTRTVSASLGKDTVRSGVYASLAGVTMVALFIIAYYKGAGIISCICLALNALMIIAAMAYFGMTLTLPGIAGLILTMGMAVDGNVLIFERIREELQLGHTVLSSVESGFRRATITIVDANLTTLIAAAVLMQFGTGPIEGFAVTLSVGIVTSVFTVLIIGRALFDLSLAKGVMKKVSMLRIVPEKTLIPFLELRNFTFLFSGAVIIVGLTCFAIRGMDNFGVDFQPGTNLMLHVDNTETVPVGDVRSALSSSGFTNPVVQESSGDSGETANVFVVRVGDITRTGEGQEEGGEQLQTVAERVQAALAPLSAVGTIDGVVVEDEQTVGPSVGAQLRLDALNAIFWALLFIVVYLWIRFEFRFAMGAVVALIHDLVVAVGIFSLLGGEISMNVIAALLTVLGYSINDTIVVFDRVREDLQAQRGKGFRFIDILNGAINATLSRTLLTSITTLFVVVVLSIFGGEAIRDFAIVLLLGIVFGTYSSVFVASSLVYLMDKKTVEGGGVTTRRGGKGRRTRAGGAKA